MNSKISMKQIRCFVAVSEELNFTRSANRLNMTQAPLTRQIQMLEDAVGARLFHRSNKSVSLTREGRIFQPYALRALSAIDTLLAPDSNILVGLSARYNWSNLDRTVTDLRRAPS
jgi:DNA-binding transcriptional LysR family regulator